MVKKSEKVWDPLVRIGHWTLVVAFFTAYFTEDDWMALHVWAGYVVGGYVLVRIVWGFVGSRYARFSRFIYKPSRVINYLQQLAAGKAQHYIGHNPAGGAMVAALLLCLSATAVTGMKLYAIEENKGPFAVFAEQPVVQTRSLASASVFQPGDLKNHDKNSAERENGRKVKKPGEGFWEDLHEFFANLTLFLVCLHVVGIAVSGYVDQEKLVKAMLTGKKDIDGTYQ